MSAILTKSTDVTFDQALVYAEKLPPMDQFKLVIQLIPKISWLFERMDFQLHANVETVSHKATAAIKRKPLRGAAAHCHPSLSLDDIRDIRHEMWSGIGDEV